MKKQFEETELDLYLKKLNSEIIWNKKQKRELRSRFLLDIEKMEFLELKEREQLDVRQAKPKQSNNTIKKLVLIPLITSLFLVFSIGVAASTIPGFNHLLSIISPQMALMLQPIDVSSEDKGIKMSVVGSINDDEMAVIYVTMQDLTDNRIDETLDIYDYSMSEGHVFNSQIVDYNETSNTATIRIQANGGESLTNRKINFQITSFLSHKQTFEEVKVNTNLMEVKNDIPQTLSLDVSNVSGGGGERFEELTEEETIEVLKPDEIELFLPEIEFMHISNIGFINDQLHIQTKWTGDDVDDHGNFYLVDSTGDKIHASNIYFDIDEWGNTKYGNEFVEYIFDVNNLDLNELKLMGDFVSNGNYTTGNWNTSFKIQSIGKEKNVNFSKEYGTWRANRFTVSPLGVTLYGNGTFNDSSEIEVNAKMNDGSVQTFDSIISFSEDEKVKVKFLSSLPLEVSKVDSINIDGIEIDY